MRATLRRVRSARSVATPGLIFVILIGGMSAADDAQRQSPKPGQVLSRFSGNWKTHTHIRRPGPPQQEIETFGKASCQATLEGRFVEFRSHTVPPGQSELQVMTYDVEAGVYRQWVFSSDGYRHEAAGRWNPTTATLVWKGKTAAGSFVIDDHWASPNRLEWTLRRTDAKGRVIQTIEGTLERASP